MAELRQADNKEFLQELKNRVIENKISEEEIFQVLARKEMITECKVADISKLSKEDWKKAYQVLENDKEYQKEVELWDAIDEEND